MALYTELYTLSQEKEHLQRTEVAIMIAAQNLVENLPADPTDAKHARAWVRAALYSPKREAVKAWNFLLAKFFDQTAEFLGSRTDAQLQGQVDALRPALVKALANE